MNSKVKGIPDLIGEFNSIIENLSAIKGESYTSAILLVVNLSNMVRMSSALLGASIDDETHARYASHITAVMQDTMNRLTGFLTEGQSEEIQLETRTNLMRDLIMVLRKQDEYQSNSPGREEKKEG